MNETANFLVGDLFNFIKRGKRIKSGDRTPGDLPFITAGTGEMGLSSYINASQTEIFPRNSLTIDMFGSVIYRGYDFGADDHVAILHDTLDRYSRRVLLYLQANIEKAIAGRYDYSNNFYASDAHTIKIELPITASGEMDLDFMEERIRVLEDAYIHELEEKRIQEKKKYLEVTGLSDYELTPTEEAVLANYRSLTLDDFESLNIATSTYKPFSIDELFDIHPTKSYGYTNNRLFKTPGNTPVVVNSSRNNGIGGYVDLDPTEPGNMITFSDTTSADSIFYQDKPFIGYSHVQGLYPKNDTIWTKEALLYVVSSFRAATRGRYNYAIKFNRDLARATRIYLPVDEKGTLDIQHMQHYTHALQKLSIKEVMRHRDTNITLTRKVASV
jgi:hypothetical protein